MFKSKVSVRFSVRSLPFCPLLCPSLHEIFPWQGFLDSSVGKESACNARDPGLIPESGRSLGKGIGYPLPYSWTSLVAQLAHCRVSYHLKFILTSLVAQMVKRLPTMQETQVLSLGQEDLLEKKQPTPIFLPGKSHGHRSLAGCSPWGHQESDSTEPLHFTSLGISNFLEDLQSFPFYCFPTFLCIVQLRKLLYLKKAFLSLLAVLWNSALSWVYLSLSSLSFTSLLFSAICKASSENHFVFLHFFLFGMVLVTASNTVFRTYYVAYQLYDRVVLLHIYLTLLIMNECFHRIYEFR